MAPCPSVDADDYVLETSLFAADSILVGWSVAMA